MGTAPPRTRPRPSRAFVFARRAGLALQLAASAIGAATLAGLVSCTPTSATTTPAETFGPWAYHVRVADPAQQFVEVMIDAPGSATGTTEFAMPAWTPGSYLIRDFARHVYDVEATARDGRALPVQRLDKQTWSVKDGKRPFSLRYRIYAAELTVRTSYVDDRMAMLNGTSVFLYEPGATTRPATLDVQVPEGWQVHTPLRSDAAGQLSAESYDELVDSPILLGRPDLRSFTVGNATFDYVLASTHVTQSRPPDLDRLADDAKIVAEAFHALMGDFPFSRYVFFMVLDPAGGGGLEHQNACAMMMTPSTFDRPNAYRRALNLTAHEFFHLWNVKRIHDAKLGPFDYAHEVYTDLLWFHEGFTETMEKRALLHAGVVDPTTYLAELEGEWNAYVRHPGRNHTPIAQLSRDAWVKAYQPSPAHRNTSISYYQKGNVLGVALEAELRARSARHGAPGGSVEGMFQDLWRERDPATQRHAISIDDIVDAASKQAGEDMQWFFDRFVYGTDEIELPAALRELGVEVSAFDLDGPYTGIEGKGRRVTAIDGDSPAARSGIMIGDEIVALGGEKIASLDDFDRRAQIGQELSVSVFRRGRILEVRLVPQAVPWRQWVFALPDEMDRPLRGFVAAD